MYTRQKLKRENKRLRKLLMNISKTAGISSFISSEISDEINDEIADRILSDFIKHSNTPRLALPILDALPIPVFLKDINGKYIECNKAFCEEFGVSKDRIIGKTVLEVYNSRDAEIYHARDMELLNKKGHQVFEHTIKDKNKKDKNVYFIKDILQNSSGEISGLIGAYIDITRQKETEKELTSAKEKAEKSDRLKSAFLANMSHEIRTPMNGIIGFADMLLSPDLTRDERENYLQIIINNGIHLLNLINDIIDISKIESGEMEIHNRIFSLNMLLDEIEESFHRIANNKDLKLTRFYSLTTDRSFIQTDDVKLRQIITNLISNSVKFTQKGYIHFGYRIIKDNIELFVKDSGIGIDEENINVIFERFVQGQTREKVAGTGLGLAISKAYCELLNGSISVESTVGKGSKFTVTIPFNPIKKEEDCAKKATSDNFSSWKNKNILIAEDEEINRLYLEKLLQKTEANIHLVTNGFDAIQFIKQNPNIDLILMDIKMPRKNGFEATRAIKGINNDLPIIAQTAYAFEEDKQRALSAGCDSFLSKPIKKEELYHILDAFLCKKV